MIHAIRLLAFAVLLILPFFSCWNSKNATTPKSGTYRLAFYNVENLFDLHDAPGKKDDDFTPKGKQHWSKDRYATKLDHLAEVIEAMEFPSIIGLEMRLCFLASIVILI